jgi:hypothetical protein
MHACNKHRPSASNARTEGARTWRSPSSLLLLLSAPLLSSALVQSNSSALRLTPVEAALATAANSGTVRRVTIALPVAAPAPAPTPLPPAPRLHTTQGECHEWRGLLQLVVIRAITRSYAPLCGKSLRYGNAGANTVIR